MLGSSAGSHGSGSHGSAAVFPYTSSRSYNSRKTLRGAAVAKNAQLTAASAGSSCSPPQVFVLGQELLQAEVQIMGKLVSEWILGICMANS